MIVFQAKSIQDVLLYVAVIVILSVLSALLMIWFSK